MTVFNRVVFFRFECCHVQWYVTRFGKDFVEFEEVRKNGQEDVHMSGVAELSGGKWSITEGEYNLKDQLWKDSPAELCQFFAEHHHELQEQPR